MAKQKRPGRPRKKDKKITISFTLSLDLVFALDREVRRLKAQDVEGDRASRSKLLQSMIESYFQSQKDKLEGQTLTEK